MFNNLLTTKFVQNQLKIYIAKAKDIILFCKCLIAYKFKSKL